MVEDAAGFGRGALGSIPWVRGAMTLADQIPSALEGAKGMASQGLKAGVSALDRYGQRKPVFGSTRPEEMLRTKYTEVLTGMYGLDRTKADKVFDVMMNMKRAGDTMTRSQDDFYDGPSLPEIEQGLSMLAGRDPKAVQGLKMALQQVGSN
jgi:hypothetical protein